MKTWKIKTLKIKKDVIKTSFLTGRILTGRKLKVVTSLLSLADIDALALMRRFGWVGKAVQAKNPLSSMKKFVMLCISHFLLLGEYHAIVK